MESLEAALLDTNAAMMMGEEEEDEREENDPDLKDEPILKIDIHVRLAISSTTRRVCVCVCTAGSPHTVPSDTITATRLLILHQSTLSFREKHFTDHWYRLLIFLTTLF